MYGEFNKVAISYFGAHKLPKPTLVGAGGCASALAPPSPGCLEVPGARDTSETGCSGQGKRWGARGPWGATKVLPGEEFAGAQADATQGLPVLPFITRQDELPHKSC